MLSRQSLPNSVKNKMKVLFILGVLLWVLLGTHTYAQVKTAGMITCDTVLITGHEFIVLDDSLIYLSGDTLIEICEHTRLLTHENGKSFYDKLRKGVEDKKLLLGLYNTLVSNPNIDTLATMVRVFKAEEKFLPFEGDAIRKIRIKRLPPFGTSIYDTLSVDSSSTVKSMNKMHIKTQEWVIRKNLMFSVHDALDPIQMVENMRILSQLPYIEDASISVTNTHADSVDILVVTRDKFPYAGFPIIRSIDNFTAYAWTENFMGLGHKLRGGMTFHSESTPNLYIAQINYGINNLTHFIDAEVNYEVGEKSQIYALRLNRDLIPSYVRWGGEFIIQDKLEQYPYDPNSGGQEYIFHYRDFDVWTSHLITLNKNSDLLKRNYLIPGLRYFQRNYSRRPAIAMDSSSRFINETFVIGNLVMARQNYDITNYLVDFGKIEYIPYGYQIRINGGYTVSEYYTSPYAGVGFDLTHYVKQLGYISYIADLGFHFSDNKIFQGAIKLESNLLSRLITYKTHHFRLMAGISYLAGLDRRSGDLIYLDDDHGIFGLSGNAFEGNKRFYYGAQLVDFTPYSILGFKFAGFVSYNGGWITSENKNLWETDMISAIGAGFYVKNNFLVFDAFQFRLSYFPITPDNVSNFSFEVSLLPLFPLINFLDTRPTKVIFD